MAHSYLMVSWSLREKLDVNFVDTDIQNMLIPEEEIVLAYMSSNEEVVFLNKRIIAKKGSTVYSIPYKSTHVFSIDKRKILKEDFEEIELRTNTGQFSIGFMNMKGEVELASKIISRGVFC